jgi:hypothetical protein
MNLYVVHKLESVKPYTLPQRYKPRTYAEKPLSGDGREANRENRRIIAGLTQRIPAIEAPQSDEDAPQSASGDLEGAGHPGTREPQEAVHRPWWRRWLGG